MKIKGSQSDLTLRLGQCLPLVTASQGINGAVRTGTLFTYVSPNEQYPHHKSWEEHWAVAQVASLRGTSSCRDTAETLFLSCHLHSGPDPSLSIFGTGSLGSTAFPATRLRIQAGTIQGPPGPCSCHAVFPGCWFTKGLYFLEQ